MTARNHLLDARRDCLRRVWRLSVGVVCATSALGAGAQVFAAGAPARALTVLAGAGYKRPTEQLCAAFTKATGIPVERGYGNLAQIFAQARAQGHVDALIGDASFIAKARGLDLPQHIPLGEGRLVLVWRKGLDAAITLANIKDVLPGLHAVAMPNPEQAIYGRAAKEWLQANGLWPMSTDRLKVVQTVPQVSAYLRNGYVDAGFINKTEALAIAPDVGGQLELPPGEHSYRRISIIVALPAADGSADAGERARFAHFLESPEAQAILRSAGL